MDFFFLHRATHFLVKEAQLLCCGGKKSKPVDLTLDEGMFSGSRDIGCSFASTESLG